MGQAYIRVEIRVHSPSGLGQMMDTTQRIENGSTALKITKIGVDTSWVNGSYAFQMRTVTVCFGYDEKYIVSHRCKTHELQAMPVQGDPEEGHGLWKSTIVRNGRCHRTLTQFRS